MNRVKAEMVNSKVLEKLMNLDSKHWSSNINININKNISSMYCSNYKACIFSFFIFKNLDQFETCSEAAKGGVRNTALRVV